MRRRGGWNRAASFDLSLAWGHQLLVVGIVGFVSFRDAHFEHDADWRYHRLIQATDYHVDGGSPQCATWADRGQDITSAQNFLMFHQHCFLTSLGDPFHRLWNNLNLVFKAAGFWEFILLCVVVVNCVGCLWKGAKWFHELVGAVERYTTLGCPDDPWFSAISSDILKAKGELARAIGTGIEQTLKDEMLDSSCRRVHGELVAWSRWSVGCKFPKVSWKRTSICGYYQFLHA